MPEEDFTDEQMQDFIENRIPEILRASKWGKLAATSKQKWKLKQLGIAFERGLLRANAFLLIRDALNKR